MDHYLRSFIRDMEAELSFRLPVFDDARLEFRVFAWTRSEFLPLMKGKIFGMGAASFSH